MMGMKFLKYFGFLATICLCAAAAALTLTSPRAKVRVDIDTGVKLSFRMQSLGRPILNSSNLGLEFLNSPAWGRVRLSRFKHHLMNRKFEMPTGKVRRVSGHYAEYNLRFREISVPFRILEVEFRLYEDGIGFRYIIPEQINLTHFKISQELNPFAVAGNPWVFHLPLSFGSSFEGIYQSLPLYDLKEDQMLGLPVMMQTPTGPFVAITEASLTDYAGLYLLPGADHQLESRLAPSLQDPAMKV